MATLTSGKATFDELYNAPDAQPYMLEMQKVRYEIGDNAASITRQVLRATCQRVGGGGDGAKRPLLMELAAGYGLTMIPIRTTLAGPKVLAYYSRADTLNRQFCEAAIAADHQQFEEAARDDLPPFEVFALDVATQALEYGKRTGLFDTVDDTDLEADGTSLDARGLALASRASVVAAVGAFSYISTKTLEKLSCWDGESSPVVAFYPLVATDMTAIIQFLEARAYHVYYERTCHWQPQRVFKDKAEAEILDARQREILGEAPWPASAKEGFVHAVPLIAVPARLWTAKEFHALAVEWITGRQA